MRTNFRINILQISAPMVAWLCTLIVGMGCTYRCDTCTCLYALSILIVGGDTDIVQRRNGEAYHLCLHVPIFHAKEGHLLPCKGSPFYIWKVTFRVAKGDLLSCLSSPSAESIDTHGLADRHRQNGGALHKKCIKSKKITLLMQGFRHFLIWYGRTVEKKQLNSR